MYFHRKGMFLPLVTLKDTINFTNKQTNMDRDWDSSPHKYYANRQTKQNKLKEGAADFNQINSIWVMGDF